jgi:agmatinase
LNLRQRGYDSNAAEDSERAALETPIRRSNNMDYKAVGLSMFGIPSFAKAKQVSLTEDWDADVAVLGIPFDQGAGFRSGTRHGPKHVRDWSIRYSHLTAPETPGYWDMRTQANRGFCSIVDCGDVDILPLVWEDNFERITESVKGILAHKAMPIVLGGDHSVTFPIVRSFEGRGPITVVQFDAHADYRDEVLGVRYGHGNVLRRVRELPHIEKILTIGLNGYKQREIDLRDHKADGNDIIHAFEIHDHGPQHYLPRLPSGQDVYITFDIDVFDASVAPGTGTPEPGGLTFVQVRQFLETLCRKNRVVGMDLVEVNPLYDPSFITALTATHVIVDTLGLLFPDKKGAS